MFETGSDGGLTLEENLAAADCVLTTSVAEGFGLVFAEGWLAGRRLIGRDLPEITSNLVEAGQRFPSIRPQLQVPLDGVGRDSFRAVMMTARQTASAAYGLRQVDNDLLKSQIDALTSRGLVDFGRLDRRQQQQAIQRVWRNERARECSARTDG